MVTVTHCFHKIVHPMFTQKYSLQLLLIETRPTRKGKAEHNRMVWFLEKNIQYMKMGM